MAVTIAKNTSSQTAQRFAADTNKELGKVFERLSTGQRINRAGDDAAGLAIADALSSNRKVYTQALRNFNDGISAVSIADAALEQLSGIVTRIKELSTQASSEAYSTSQRNALDAEAQTLSKEYIRIVQSTKFNSMGLLNGSTSNLALQGGYGADGIIQSTLGGAVGTGSFTVGQSAAAGFSIAAELADLNGDGFLDLISGDASFGILSISFGLGNGSFGSASTLATASSTINDIVAADMNNDGILDLVVGGDGPVEIFTNNGAGSFTLTRSIAYGLTEVTTLDIGDFNNDGATDIAVASYSGPAGAAQLITGSSSGTYSLGATYATETLSTAELLLADLDNDGDLDLLSNGYAAGNVSYTTVRLNDGSGSFGTATSYQNFFNNSTSFDLGDINGDGFLDVVSSGGSVLDVRLGNGNGTFGSRITYSVSGVNNAILRLGDVDGDGNLDAVIANNSGTVRVARGLGNGQFSSATTASAVTSAYDLVLGDTNNDGVTDFTVIGATSIGSFINGTTSGTSALQLFSLKTMADARWASSLMSTALNNITKQRGTLGAFQSRLGSAVSLVRNISDNYAVAEDRIRSADVADEASKMIRLQVLQNASTAIMAQANQSPATALRLLKSQG